jgi:hypothetical protein
VVVYCITSRSWIVHLYGDVTTANEGLQNLGLRSALRAVEQDGKGCLHHATRTDTKPRFFWFHPKKHPLPTHKGLLGTYSNPELPVSVKVDCLFTVLGRKTVNNKSINVQSGNVDSKCRQCWTLKIRKKNLYTKNRESVPLTLYFFQMSVAVPRW